MGLDMYLNKHLYVQNWDFMEPKDKHTITVKKGGKERTDIDTSKIKYLIMETGYWRKANAIHQWFVINCQDGNDDCGTHYVSREQLGTLRDTCKKVLDDSSKAKELLPTQEGFFFGGKGYDEWYADDLTLTIEIIDEALKDKDGDYYYSSSW